MLFEMNENPKIIQALLGHKSVKTTLTVYNSVDKTYFKEATEKLNNLFNSEKMANFQKLQEKRNTPAQLRNIEEIEETEVDEDPEIALLERLLAEKKLRKKNQDSEM